MNGMPLSLAIRRVQTKEKSVYTLQGTNNSVTQYLTYISLYSKVVHTNHQLQPSTHSCNMLNVYSQIMPHIHTNVPNVKEEKTRLQWQTVTTKKNKKNCTAKAEPKANKYKE